MPYYPVNTNKRTERKLTLGQLITMATRLMKASIHKCQKSYSNQWLVLIKIRSYRSLT